MVPPTRRRASGTHPANRDHHDGAQALDRSLAVCHSGDRTGGRHPRSLSFDRRRSRRSMDDATVFVIGSFTLPRSRWVG
jgi:hypothetical protein